MPLQLTVAYMPLTSMEPEIKQHIFETLHQYSHAVPLSNVIGKKPTVCPICLQLLTSGTIHMITQCEDLFHKECLFRMLATQPKGYIRCPVCQTVSGTRIGIQPESGTMEICKSSERLNNYPSCGSIEIKYDFDPPEVQRYFHPSPGENISVRGFPRKCYLPDNEKGNNILNLLKTAFKRKLVFTVGTSLTTGRKNLITWNEIRHWCSKRTFPSEYFLDGVLRDLGAFGIESEKPTGNVHNTASTMASNSNDQNKFDKKVSKKQIPMVFPNGGIPRTSGTVASNSNDQNKFAKFLSKKQIPMVFPNGGIPRTSGTVASNSNDQQQFDKKVSSKQAPTVFLNGTVPRTVSAMASNSNDVHTAIDPFHGNPMKNKPYEAPDSVRVITKSCDMVTETSQINLRKPVGSFKKRDFTIKNTSAKIEKESCEDVITRDDSKMPQVSIQGIKEKLIAKSTASNNNFNVTNVANAPVTTMPVNSDKNNLIFSPSSHWTSQINSEILDGEIVNLIPNMEFGFIKATLPSEFPRKLVYFNFDCVVNTSSGVITLCESQNVQFTLNQEKQFVSKPTASNVILTGKESYKRDVENEGTCSSPDGFTHSAYLNDYDEEIASESKRNNADKERRLSSTKSPQNIAAVDVEEVLPTSIKIRKDQKELVYAPTGKSIDQISGKKISGKIVKLTLQKSGFIKANLPIEFAKKDVYFKFDCVINISMDEVTLCENLNVQFTLKGKGEQCFSKPSALKVILIGNSSIKKKEIQPSSIVASSNKNAWNTGQIVAITSIIIARDNELDKKVLLHPEKISLHTLPLKKGDIVSYIPNNRKADILKVKKAKVLFFRTRSQEELVCYLWELQKSLQSENEIRVLQEIVSVKEQWKLYAEFNGDGEMELLFFAVMSLLEKFILYEDWKVKLLLPVIVTLLESWVIVNCKPFLSAQNLECLLPEHSMFEHSDWSRQEFLNWFCMQIINNVSSLSYALGPLLECLQCSSCHGCRNMMNLLSASLSLRSASGQFTVKVHWKKTPLVLKTNELLCDDFIALQNIYPVKVSSPYSSPEEYMETYFHLFRVESYYGISNGVNKLLKGTLDKRDMNVYHSVKVTGINIAQNGINLLVKFSPVKPVKNWEQSMQLMPGNLLCISPNQSFNDAIWATVQIRDVDCLKSSSSILVHIYDLVDSKLGEILNTLLQSNGHAVMAESPTHFSSVEPILRALKKLKIEDFKLNKQLIKGQHTVGVKYLSRFKQSPVSDIALDERDNIPHVKVQAQMDKLKTLLDKDQWEALNYAMESPLAVIQGPPGCGKTFLGVKLAELILCCNLDRPILILTFKNHALDEFLLHAIKFCSTDDIVRLGGRSKSKEIQKCMIQEHLNSDNSMSRIFEDQKFEIRDEIRDATQTVENAIVALYKDTCLTAVSLVSTLNEAQLCSLLIGANYKSNQSLTFKIQGKFASTQMLLNDVIPQVKGLHGSLQNYVSECASDSDSSKSKELWSLLLLVAATWLPARSDVENIQKLLRKSIVIAESDDKRNASKKKDEEDEDESNVDEEYVKSFQASRSAAIGTPARILKSIILSKEEPKSLFHLSDFPFAMTVNHTLLQTTKMWSLDSPQRIQFIHSLLLARSKSASELVDECNTELSNLIDRKKFLDLEKKWSIIKNKKIVGATITGAAINHDLIHLIKPSVVIVEEAAEIMEPSLLATLNNDVEHLILIGDHMQLRPTVDTYILAKDYNLDISLMERLIKLKYPFKALTRQSRMRPEFSALLRDIYPNLTDNLEKVEHNTPPAYMASSMFFWDHHHYEDGIQQTKDDGSRSKVNSKEAAMVVSLAAFMIVHGSDVSEITIITAYLGQTAIIRKLLKSTSQQLKILNLPSIQVQTIDNFQGDENNIVIVSLVRSNKDGVAGFVNTLNRRCVAQSRARSALYIIGNTDTICCQKGKKSSVWEPLVNQMNQKSCVGNSIKVKCPNENHKKILSVTTNDNFLSLIANPAMLCAEICGYLFTCEKAEHACTQKCKPDHHHGYCTKMVKFVHTECLHEDKKHCYEDPADLLCNTMIDFEYQACKHITKKKCHVSENTMPACSKSCRAPMDNCHHDCEKKCGSKHHHKICMVEVKFNRKSCSHEGVKRCSQDENATDCPVIVAKVLSPCRHVVKAECFKQETNIKCTHICNEELKCGKHRCKEICGEIHTHEVCQEKVPFEYPKCGHAGEKKKKCTATIDTECQVLVTDKGVCGHSIQHPCFKSVAMVTCQRPCEKLLPECNHLCSNKCGESCTKQQCKMCQKDFQGSLDCFKKEAEKKARHIANTMADLQSSSIVRRIKIKNSGTSKAEYVKVEDQVMKSIKSHHNWHPDVTMIEKVINLNLELKFEKYKSRMHGYFTDEKFHGTSNEGVNGIIKDGFRLPGPPSFGSKPGMYGQGIYFATDSSKSAQMIYTKNSNKILLCKVLLGNSKVLHQANNAITKTILDREGCDSVHAPRGTAVQNDEFVVFEPAQALPIYIIHFSASCIPALPSLRTIATQRFERRPLQPSRTFDPSDENGNLYRTAESIYYRQVSMRATQNIMNQLKQLSIDSIDYVVNEDLLDKFEKKKKDFQSRSIPHHEILAFHGTLPNNVDSILRNNLDPGRTAAHGRAYGAGVYFSEFPDFSLKYGKALILFRVLPGREREFSRSAPPAAPANSAFYQSTKVNSNSDECGEQLVVQDAHQYVPYFVYNLK